MRLHSCSFALAAIGALGGPIFGQQFATAPSSASTTDGNSSALIAGLSSTGRQQVLLDASVLAPLTGTSLQGLTFRRDANWTKALAGGAANLTITLSPTSRKAVEASESFDANLDPIATNRVLVFQGVVNVPASADAATRSVDWANTQDVVDIAFATPFVYIGGNLCIDISGGPIVGQEVPAWVADGVSDSATGSVVDVGAPCGALGPADANATVLVPGFSFSFLATGAAGTPAAFLFGPSLPAIDLAAVGLGGPGCELRVDPIIALGTTFEDRSAFGWTTGGARVGIQVPSNPGILSSAFSCQFLSLTNPIETTNGLDCTIAAIAPTLGMATVYARAIGAGVPSSGQVFSDRAPVLRFRY